MNQIQSTESSVAKEPTILAELHSGMADLNARLSATLNEAEGHVNALVGGPPDDAAAEAPRQVRAGMIGDMFNTLTNLEDQASRLNNLCYRLGAL